MEKQIKNKVHFFKEKKWIMAWWYKKNCKYQLSENQMLIQWLKWWKNDFVDKNDERFQSAYEWVKNTVQTMTMDEIKKRRCDIADNSSMPSYINRIANKKGYYVKKSITKNHPMSVSGYAIFEGKNKRPICGHHFDLTIKQVREFLERQ